MPDLRILVQKAKPRNWGDQSGRALGVGEKKKIDEAILRLKKFLDANADKFKLIHVPQAELIEFLMQTANIPTSTNKDGSENKDGFGAKSLKNYLSVRHQEFPDRLKPNGRTTQTAMVLWQLLKKQDSLP